MADNPTFPPTQRIGIFVFDGFEPIDVFGFVEAFSIARFLGKDYGSKPPYPFEIVLIGKEIAKVKSTNGPSVMPDWDFAQALRKPLDLLMVPGGGGTWPLVEGDPASLAKLIKWMRAMDKQEGAHHGVGLYRRRRPRQVRVPQRAAGCHQPRRVRMGRRARPLGAVGQRLALGRRRQIRDLRWRVGRH
jgi:hypothetical protein